MCSQEFRRGIEQFNRRSFFECHDTLEELWHGTRGKDRLFLQGLIQISVGFYHLFGRNYKGAASQFTRGLGKLEPYRPAHNGINLEEFERAIAPWLERAERGLKGDHPELDESNVPVIQLSKGECACRQ